MAGVALGGCGSARTSVSGAEVFRTACSACHSLIGNESRHLSGGDLVGYGLTRASLVQYVQEMPLRVPLGPHELRAVVEYVLRVQARRPTR